jgi:hypothetical protein
MLRGSTVTKKSKRWRQLLASDFQYQARLQNYGLFQYSNVRIVSGCLVITGKTKVIFFFPLKLYSHYCFARLSAEQPHRVQIFPRGSSGLARVTKCFYSLAIHFVTLKCQFSRGSNLLNTHRILRTYPILQWERSIFFTEWVLFPFAQNFSNLTHQEWSTY